MGGGWLRDTFHSPGHHALVARSRDGVVSRVTRPLFSSVITPAHLATPGQRQSPRSTRLAISAVHSSRQPCTSGPELPASPRRRRGLWERLPWIRAWQRLGVQLWPAEAQASRLLPAHSPSARSPRREVGEGPGSSWPSALLPCSLPGA